MIIRQAIDKLQIKATRAPAIAILGPRQVGKTTLAHQFGASHPEGYIYLDLESPTDQAKLLDAEAFLAQYADKLVVLDEVQQMPALFSTLRSVIDRNCRPGRFLLLGSASPHLVNGVSESLAGRITYMELGPLQLTELPDSYSQAYHWYRGGFPPAFLAADDAAFNDWAGNFVRSYAERDFRLLFGYDLNPAIISRLWQMIAYSQGTLWNAETYARSLGVTAPVVNRYLDFMEGGFLVRKLMPWFNNTHKRLVKSPRIYVRDSGLVHYLNRISSYDLLQGHPVVGGSWEGYVTEQIYFSKKDDTDIYFYRTHNGAEVDIVLVRGMQPIACIEIKYSNAPSISKGFYSSVNDLGTEKNFVITPGSDTYPAGKGTMVCSLRYFLNNYIGSL